ncbi:MAG TPA: DUF3089 domain-containing protein [Solirubrobacteraceae bacterium]|jgi:hypothetical protein
MTAAASAALATAASAKPVWLCFPGHHPDPCASGLSTTVYSPTLTRKLGVQHPKPVAHPGIDCFYVYPTVSGQRSGNANLQIDPADRSIALYQAARYSQYCRVFAPMYRQLTIVARSNGAFGKPTSKPDPATAYSDIRDAFLTYLRKHNRGRGFVLIGHSQGSSVLRRLIASEVDPRPAVRKLLVSAIVLGGDVVVNRGTGIGGDFKHIPACRSASQTGCVIAYSTYDQTPPVGALFGHPVSINGKPITNPNLQVLCTNPAALGGGSGVITPIQPSQPFAPGLFALGIAALKYDVPVPHTVWWSAPGSYRARCETVNGATVLMISPLRGAPLPAPSPVPAWGLHLLDAQVALGNLVSDVKTEAAAFLRRGR